MRGGEQRIRGGEEELRRPPLRAWPRLPVRELQPQLHELWRGQVFAVRRRGLHQLRGRLVQLGLAGERVRAMHRRPRHVSGGGRRRQDHVHAVRGCVRSTCRIIEKMILKQTVSR